MTSLGASLRIETNTRPEAIQRERMQAKNKTSKSGTTKDDPEEKPTEPEDTDNSDYMYPTLVIVPMIIILITLMTLGISIITKVILAILIVLAIGVFVLYFRKQNITEPINSFASNFSSKKNQNRSLNFTN